MSEEELKKARAEELAEAIALAEERKAERRPKRVAKKFVSKMQNVFSAPDGSIIWAIKKIGEWIHTFVEAINEYAKTRRVQNRIKAQDRKAQEEAEYAQSVQERSR